MSGLISGSGEIHPDSGKTESVWEPCLKYRIFVDDENITKRYFVAEVRHFTDFGQVCCFCQLLGSDLNIAKAAAMRTIETGVYDDNSVFDCDYVLDRVECFLLEYPWDPHMIPNSDFKNGHCETKPYSNNIPFISELSTDIKDFTEGNADGDKHKSAAQWCPRSATQDFDCSVNLDESFLRIEENGFLAGALRLRGYPRRGELVFIDLRAVQTSYAVNRFILVCVTDGPFSPLSSSIYPSSEDINNNNNNNKNILLENIDCGIYHVYDGRKTFEAVCNSFRYLDEETVETVALQLLYTSHYDFHQTKQSLIQWFEAHPRSPVGVPGISLDDAVHIIDQFESSTLTTMASTENSEPNLATVHKTLEGRYPMKTLVDVYYKLYVRGGGRSGGRQLRQILRRGSLASRPPSITRPPETQHVFGEDGSGGLRRRSRKVSRPGRFVEDLSYVDPELRTSRLDRKSHDRSTKRDRQSPPSSVSDSNDSDWSLTSLCGVCGQPEASAAALRRFYSVVEGGRAGNGDGGDGEGDGRTDAQESERDSRRDKSCLTRNLMLLCDNCDDAFHPLCLGLVSVPEGDWYCPDCSGISGQDGQSSSIVPSVDHFPRQNNRKRERTFKDSSERPDVVNRKTRGRPSDKPAKASRPNSSGSGSEDETSSDSLMKTDLLVQQLMTRRHVLCTLSFLADTAESLSVSSYEKFVHIFIRILSRQENTAVTSDAPTRVENRCLNDIDEAIELLNGYPDLSSSFRCFLPL